MATRIKKVHVRSNGTDRYYMKAYSPSSAGIEKIAKRVAQSSTYSEGEAMGVTKEVMNNSIDLLLNGSKIVLPGLGTFRVKVIGTSNADKSKVTAASVKSLTLQYIPADELIQKLNQDLDLEVVDNSGDTEDTDTDETSTSEGEDSGSSSSSTPATGDDEA